jgi:ZIP family zinc transporter
MVGETAKSHGERAAEPARQFKNQTKMFSSAMAGLISGAAIIIGALLGLYMKVSNRIVAGVMAFGAGVLISALSFDLMGDAYERSHDALVVSLSFLAGAVVFVGGDWLIDRRGGGMRKNSHGQVLKDKIDADDSGKAILLGTLLDGIPESFVVGASIAEGGGAGVVFITAVFLNNLPEGISGTIGMKRAGMRPGTIMWLWTATLAMTVLSAMAGYALLGNAAPEVHAATTAFASGAILAMLSDTMIPEAFRFGGRGVALVTVVGFLLAFMLGRMG